MSKSQIKRLVEQTHKPVVQYEELLMPLQKGEYAYVRRIVGHPRQGDPDLYGLGAVRTSPVVRIHDNGVFETLNTIYKRME